VGVTRTRGRRNVYSLKFRYPEEKRRREEGKETRREEKK